MKKRFLCALSALILIFGISGCSEKNKTNPENAEEFLISTISGIGLCDFYSYSGEYVEDGSDELVSNIAAIRVKNTSDVPYQTLKLSLKVEDENYEFFITTLLPGDVVTVLEKYKKTFAGNGKYNAFDITESSQFAKTPSVYEKKFKADIFDGIMNLTNTSGKNFENDVYVYYKTKDTEGYFGGITYRINFGPLKKGELSQRNSSHLYSDASEIVFITYGE